MTKLLIIFTICFLSFVSSNDSTNKLQTLAEKCKPRVKASDDDVKDLVIDSPAKTPAAKCLHACVLKELKLVDKNGKFQRKEFLEYTKTNCMNNEKRVEVTMKAFDVCNKKGLVITEKKCDSAEVFRICMREEGIKLMSQTA